jgi:uncharacterized protein (TIGR03435 family)
LPGAIPWKAGLHVGTNVAHRRSIGRHFTSQDFDQRSRPHPASESERAIKIPNDVFHVRLQSAVYNFGGAANRRSSLLTLMNRSRVHRDWHFPVLRLRPVLPVITVICAVSLPLWAQPPREGAKPQVFEVTSVRPNRSGSDSSHAKSAPGRYDATNVKVKELIQDAFGVKDFQISGAPSWTDTEGFDIAATTGVSTNLTAREFEPILQSLLAERFQLRFHRETKEMLAYRLVAARNGPKLSVHSGDDESGPSIRHGSGKLILSANKVSMSGFADVLSRRTGRPVLDGTGLSGEYDFKLEWAPDPTAESVDASIFAALQEQLGLRLESTKAPVGIIVVDNVEKPSGN